MEQPSTSAQAQASSCDQVCPYNPFCLGMCEWTGCPGGDKPHPQLSTPLTSNQVLPSSASKENAPPTKRFKFAANETLAELSKGFIPANTNKATKWALNVYDQWKEARNKNPDTESVPDDFFATTDPVVLNTHLSRLAVECRKVNGESYPPSSIYQLLSGILRHMRNSNPGCLNFLDKKDPRFRSLHRTLDAHFHQLHSDGIGVQVKNTEILTIEEENQLWTSNVMSLTTPKSLLNAAFYVAGKFFALRGGVEHRNLKLSQIKRYQEPDHYIYYENVSKNRNGSFQQLHIKGKKVPVYPVPEAGDRCPVKILDTYISKLPHFATENDLFYLRPLAQTPTNPLAPWYAQVPLGRDSLNKKLLLKY